MKKALITDQQQRLQSYKLYGLTAVVFGLLWFTAVYLLPSKDSHVHIIGLIPSSLRRTCAHSLAEATLSNTTEPKLDAKLLEQLSSQKEIQQRLDLFLTSRSVELDEGHTGLFPLQQQVYLALAANPCVEHICEVGFNAGHSATVWLSAKATNRLTVFDLGKHPYVLEAARFIREAFPNRLTLKSGNPMDTVPDAVRTHQPRCDLLVVDASHDPATALADIRHMRDLATRAFHILVVDDVYCEAARCAGPTRALEEAVQRGTVLVLQQWTDPSRSHGFAVGMYLF